MCIMLSLLFLMCVFNVCSWISYYALCVLCVYGVFLRLYRCLFPVIFLYVYVVASVYVFMCLCMFVFIVFCCCHMVFDLRVLYGCLCLFIYVVCVSFVPNNPLLFLLLVCVHVVFTCVYVFV